MGNNIEGGKILDFPIQVPLEDRADKQQINLRIAAASSDRTTDQMLWQFAKRDRWARELILATQSPCPLPANVRPLRPYSEDPSA